MSLISSTKSDPLINPFRNIKDQEHGSSNDTSLQQEHLARAAVLTESSHILSLSTNEVVVIEHVEHVLSLYLLAYLLVFEVFYLRFFNNFKKLHRNQEVGELDHLRHLKFINSIEGHHGGDVVGNIQSRIIMNLK